MVIPLIYHEHMRHFKNKTKPLQDKEVFAASPGSVQRLVASPGGWKLLVSQSGLFFLYMEIDVRRY